MKVLYALLLLILHSSTAAAQETPTWRYYRPSNTGIQGDYCEAIWLDPDGHPYIGGYSPGFEEGGFSVYLEDENRWINYSNVNLPVIGHPDSTGAPRVGDIVADAAGQLWLGTGRGALRFDPAVGASSLVNLAQESPALALGGCRDLDIAPDGTIWFALLGWGGNVGGLVRHTPATGSWSYWTGGSEPSGGDGWPQLVWSVRAVSVQPKPGGGYKVWCDSENGAAIVSFDSDTARFVYHEFSFTTGSILDMPGKDCIDDSGNVWMRRFAGFVGSDPTYSLDYRRPDGAWVSPPQITLPAVDPPIWAFRAFGDRNALLVDGMSRVRRFDGAAWHDYGIWREGAFSYDVNIDQQENVWACGIGGAAKRNATTGEWQRVRVSNTSQYDFFNRDLSIDPATGRVYICANAGTGVGGMTLFDGIRWTGFNNAEYGLGLPWPFPTDNSDAVAFRPSTGHVAVNPMYDAIHEWNGTSWTDLGGMETSRGMVEDSFGRLWSIGDYPAGLQYYAGDSWTQVRAMNGRSVRSDPSRAGTVWAAGGGEVLRTDGTVLFLRTPENFPELDPQSDFFTTVAPRPDGIAWLGSNRGLFRIDPASGAYQFYSPNNSGIPAEWISPLAVTPDGRLWFSFSESQVSANSGLGWFDGVSFGFYLAPPDGAFRWDGLPHASIADLEVRVLPEAYELWMSCLSRGIAVLHVPYNPTSVSNPATPQTFMLGQNYPNPFNPNTTIEYRIQERGFVSLRVFDMLGREVATLVHEEKSAGSYSVHWDAANTGTGTYFYRLESNGRREIRKMIFVK